MDRRTLTALALATVGIMVLVALFWNSGISGGLIAEAESEARSLTRDRSTTESQRNEIVKALAAEPALFRSRSLDTEWPARLETAAAKLREAEQELDLARKLIAENDPEKENDLREHLRNAHSARTFAKSEVTEIHEAAGKWLDLKRNLKTNLQRMEEQVKQIAAIDLSPVEAAVTRAAIDWPKKKADLEGRLQGLRKLVQISQSVWAEAATQREAAQRKDLAGVDFNQLHNLRGTLENNLASLNTGVKHIPGLVDQLYWSWDKILVDMEIREGSDVTFYHKYQIVKTHSTNVEAKENPQAKSEITTEESLVKVSKAEYKAKEPNMGMVVERKSSGKYNHEVEKVVQPPGFAYICPPEERRNRYGYWNNRGGSSFWVFYGQYSLMRHIFWGRSYGGWVTPTYYRSYRGAYDYGRPYYGRDSAGRARFGKSGTLTRSKYSSSRYVKSDGFKSSKYVKSGGTYRGSRYQTRSSSSSRTGFFSSRRSSSSRSSSFGGSRFGGGK